MSLPLRAEMRWFCGFAAGGARRQRVLQPDGRLPQQTLQVTDVAGGWHDVGIVDGKNKLVPSLSSASANRRT